MLVLKKIFLIILLATGGTNQCHLPFDQVVIWGHKLHSHTHSYVHEAFYKAFKHLGYTTHWFDNADDVSRFDFKKTLFITEHQVDQNIPVRDDCFYVNLYSDNPRFDEVKKNGHLLELRWYHMTDVEAQSNLIKLEECVYASLEEKCLHMPWATDLLPHEIEAIKKKVPALLKQRKKSRTITWVGTIGDGVIGNIHQLKPFMQACKNEKIRFKKQINVNAQEHQKLIQTSYIAPAIVGAIQAQNGCVPCRIFKNISNGQMGVTNSHRIYTLFNKKIVYNPNTYELFFDAQKRLTTLTAEEIYELMDFVKDNHTYLNRIQAILTVMEQIHNNANPHHCNATKGAVKGI